MFKIIKRESGWWHIFNNDSKEVNISDFEAVLDNVAQTFIIQNLNGANVPKLAVSITDIVVIDETDASVVGELATGTGGTAVVDSDDTILDYINEAAIEMTRPVAHAIRITSPVAPTAATGFVHIAISTESTYGQVTWQYPTTIAEISGCQFYKRVTLASLTQSPLTIINKWIDDTAWRYSSPASNLGSAVSNHFQTDYAWGAIVILLEGCPVSTVVLSAEHLLSSEGIPDKNSPLIGTSAAANSSGVLSATSDMQANTEPFHTEQEQEGYLSRSATAFAQGAREQGERIFEKYAVPIAQHVGGLAASSVVDRLFDRPGISGVNQNPHRISN